ncbi:MAG: amidohydrolase family protein, partial [Vicinamibacteria bacterium]
MRALLCYTSLVLAAACLPSGPKADLVLRGGKIITLSAERPVAEALAVTGGRITTVGTTAEINDFVGQETRVLDLNGALAVPGFIDSHAHFMDLGFAQLRLDLVGTRSSSEIVRKLKDVAALVKEDGEDEEEVEVVWIRGHGWDQNDWREKEFHT